MTHNHDAIPTSRQTSAEDAQPRDDEAQHGEGHSMWWMVACCAPMVLLALAIVLGVFGSR